MSKPFFSICIPAFKNPAYLERLLDSITRQTFRDFEVIISDDSPDDSISDLINKYQSFPSLVYFKNNPAQGTPSNWNAGIIKAKGEWIKLMHDDDWLSTSESLAKFANAAKQHSSASFIFSSYRNVDTNFGQDKIENDPALNASETVIRPELFRLKEAIRNPVSLLSKNIIGPPSVTIHKNDQHHFYDAELKWLVDMDFYIRFLNDGNKIAYINEPLVNIGISSLQVTKSSSLVREVEIPEHFHILEKTGTSHLKNMLVYDAWWRLFRNLRIRSIEEIKAAGYNGDVPVQLRNIISFQRKFSFSALRLGPVSKSLMLFCYTFRS